MVSEISLALLIVFIAVLSVYFLKEKLLPEKRCKTTETNHGHQCRRDSITSTKQNLSTRSNSRNTVPKKRNELILIRPETSRSDQEQERDISLSRQRSFHNIDTPFPMFNEDHDFSNFFSNVNTAVSPATSEILEAELDNLSDLIIRNVSPAPLDNERKSDDDPSTPSPTDSL